MRTHYYHDERDPRLGIVIIPEIETEIEVSTRLDGGELVMTVDDVFVGGKSLLDGYQVTLELAYRIIDAAQAEIDRHGPLFERVRDAEGWSLSRLPNDPDTRWIRSE